LRWQVPNINRCKLFEDPIVQGCAVLNDALREPANMRINIKTHTQSYSREYSQLDFLLSVLNRVRSVTDVTADSKSKVAADGAYPDLPVRNMDKFVRSNHIPGAETSGLVVPNMTRPVLTASRPCHTMATTGPEAMYFMRPGKKGLPFRSA
jgi:hypothetical protein